MPANLPAQYFEAEKRYREARSPEEKIAALEEMLTIMPKHKGTDKLRADIRRRISRVRTHSRAHKETSRKENAFMIEKEGAAQVVVIGPPNAGKSSLVAALTRADPEVADYPHTTWKPTPGMAPFQNIQFQLVDTPPLSGEYTDPLMANLLRRADMLLLLLDLKTDPLEQFEETAAVLCEWRVFPKGPPLPADLTKPPFIKKCLRVVNKVDDHEAEEDYAVFQELAETKLPGLGVSALTGRNLQNMVAMIYELADIIRVYSKSPGKTHDEGAPFVLPKGSTLEELAVKIHKDFVSGLKFARVWGDAVFKGQAVQRDYVLQEGDVVEFHI